MRHTTEKFKQAYELLGSLSWGLHNGEKKELFWCSKKIDHLEQSEVNNLKLAINDNLPDSMQWEHTQRQNPYKNYFYFLQHRRQLQQESSPDRSQWIIVSNQEIVFRGSTCAKVFDMMEQHSWPGAIAVNCNSYEAMWVAGKPYTSPEAMDRRLFDAYDLFSGPWGGMKNNAPQPLYHCETLTGLVGVRWETLACIMDRDNHIIMTRNDTEEWLHNGDTRLNNYEAQRRLCKAVCDACDEEKEYTSKREWGRWEKE